MRKELMFDNGLTAKGVATRNNNVSKMPFGPVSAEYRSKHKAAIGRAAYSGKAYLYIIGEMAAAIDREACLTAWKMNGNTEALAEIVLHPAIYGESMSDTEAGKRLGMTCGGYQKIWRQRVELLREKYRSWSTV